MLQLVCLTKSPNSADIRLWGRSHSNTTPIALRPCSESPDTETKQLMSHELHLVVEFDFSRPKDVSDSKPQLKPYKWHYPLAASAQFYVDHGYQMNSCQWHFADEGLLRRKCFLSVLSCVCLSLVFLPIAILLVKLDWFGACAVGWAEWKPMM